MSETRATTRSAALTCLFLILGTGPAFAGLVFEWVSVHVYEGSHLVELDPALASGTVELADGIAFGDLATASDIASLAFDDNFYDFWDETFLSTAAFVVEPSGLGLGSSAPPRAGPRLKEALLTLSAAVDDDGNPIDRRDSRKLANKALLTLGTAGKTKTLPDPAMPADADLWLWETSQNSQVTYSGEGFWLLDASSVPVPEPSGIFLVAAGIAGVSLLLRRRKPAG